MPFKYFTTVEYLLHHYSWNVAVPSLKFIVAVIRSMISAASESGVFHYLQILPSKCTM